ncbi:helix-turn-helix domain-containing protein [Faecalibacterium sp. An192]|uniref:helix-turn-helix domain-containing protein n=1 Tax=Faecalibacterium sp. An192 TaxID=1965581 RepID=UPI001FA85167|nr:helix-turn-helix domain-containing protein [Faecalibacterium sp. An192]
MEHELEQEYKRIGLKIAYYRKLQGYTQEKLADKLGVADRSHRPPLHLESSV